MITTTQMTTNQRSRRLMKTTFPPTQGTASLDEQELEKAHNVYTAQQSQCYAAYNPPYISERRDKNKRRISSSVSSSSVMRQAQALRRARSDPRSRGSIKLGDPADVVRRISSASSVHPLATHQQQQQHQQHQQHKAQLTSTLPNTIDQIYSFGKLREDDAT
ncbi:hypothetical protein H4Q26_003436 [Puccinia striiformis f. sp. tritici PST-130]|nr:hypothetical protein H4Q26_003436 [Puccinia striiformis f. sp. tritici PST-130]